MSSDKGKGPPIPSHTLLALLSHLKCCPHPENPHRATIPNTQQQV